VQAGRARRPAERERRHAGQALVDVAERLLDAEDQGHDPGHHREVQQRVVVARDARLHPTRARAHPALGHERYNVDVRPPQRHRDGHAEQGSRADLRPEVEALGAHADGDDRLGERDEDDEPVTPGEVTGVTCQPLTPAPMSQP
jgi:hypothetical protein